MRNGFLGLAIVLFAGCSGGEGSSFGGVDTEDPSQFCRASAAATCDKWFGCLTATEREREGIPETRADCERQFESSCERGIDNCVDATHGYIAGNAATCIEELEGAHCNDVIDPWFDAPACDRVCERTAGQFEVRWRFEPFYLCSELRVKHVTLIASLSSKQFVKSFACEDRRGTSDVIPVGTYKIRVELHDDAGARIWATDLASDAIDAAVVDLGELVIPVSS
jgi:hypothetical protein